MIQTISKRISALRKEMGKYGIGAYIISGSDPHLSEYPAGHWQSRQWISGFTGSAGTVVVTIDKAGLWTDSRYFLQAEKQLAGTPVDLYKLSAPDTPSVMEFLLLELGSGSTVGFDGKTHSVTDALTLKETLNKSNIQTETTFSLIDNIWEDRPPVPENMLFEMPVEICGETAAGKINRINGLLRAAGADCLIMSALDEIAWAFNIRGTDIAYNPVAISYGFISEKESILFVDPSKLTVEIAERLKKEGVIPVDYSGIESYISGLPAGAKVFIDPDKTNFTLYNAIPERCEILKGITPANHLKSIKNEAEIKGIKNALAKDGIALTRFYIWLEEQMKEGNRLTEISASAKLASLRAEQPLYIMDSFATICGYAENGASPHYCASPESDAEIKPGGLLLIDSGAQYLDGTTDITRTISTGVPSAQMKKDFTRVLKGHISLAKCKFPNNTRGSQLDILARKALWDSGINYLHGTGHGVGHCLNVHEGPQSIRMEENPATLKPNMLISNEPAMYRPGEYGIRTENLILVRKDSETEFGKFLNFETLTLCYIDTGLIVVPMLSERERTWLNKYHQMVYEQLSPHLTTGESEWLKEKTKEI